MIINNIRNFSIIAHIDHGKSTLADRMLELTNTVEKRKMREQVLDSMELERERGITIKMQPVRMIYRPTDDRRLTTNDQQQTPSTKAKLGMGQAINNKTSENTDELSVAGGELSNSEYILNLIDTPGHIDFSYEVSRALKAVEGAILLVDSTQGVQAQTLTTLSMAQELGITIIPVLSKIDSPRARIKEVKEEVVTLLNCSEEEILLCSGKTGEGVRELMEELIDRISPPESKYEKNNDVRALIFDFNYSSHKGVAVYVRVFDGVIKKGDKLVFAAAGKSFTALEVGSFSPDVVPKESLSAGEIGYVVTGIKQAGIASVGDTLFKSGNSLPILAGYMNPSPVVWASVYPLSQDDFSELKQSLERLKLSDSSLSFEEESSGVLGRGFRCGFLGMLHLEIVTERLKREFNLELTVTMPSITYEIEDHKGNRKYVYSPVHFPDDGSVKQIYEPWVELNIITPASYVGSIMQLLFEYEAVAGESETFGDGRVKFNVEMPLRELMRNFFGRIKTASSGYASLSYTITALRKADVVRLDVLVAERVVPAFSRVVSRRRVQEEAEQTVERLYKILPRQLFAAKIQAKSMGRILSAKKLSALKKDVTGHLYGGDITRKRKLWEKQKKGKKKLKERGEINIPHDVFLKMVRAD